MSMAFPYGRLAEEMCNELIKLTIQNRSLSFGILEQWLAMSKTETNSECKNSSNSQYANRGETPLTL